MDKSVHPLEPPSWWMLPTPVTLDTTLLVVRAELVEQVQCGQETLQCATVSFLSNWHTYTLCFDFLFFFLFSVIPLSSGSVVITNNSVISLATIGSSALTCRTELSTCCRGEDNNGNALGRWRGPDGDLPDYNTDGFYVSREMSSISLNLTEGSSEPAGTYCCQVPRDSGATTTHCVMVTSTGECDGWKMQVD